MENEELQRLVEEISIKDFGKPFLHKAVFNPRLRSTGGRYLLRSHHIEINKKYFDQFGETELVGIIKHELCHYHLHLEGKGYQHRDRDFRELMKQVNAPRFCSTLPEQQKRRATRKVLEYKCMKCGLLYQRKRVIDTQRFVCGKCRGKLKFIKELTNK